MKRLLIIALAAILGIAIVFALFYLFASFVNYSFDARLWTEESRAFVGVFGGYVGIWGGVLFGIVANNFIKPKE